MISLNKSIKIKNYIVAPSSDYAIKVFWMFFHFEAPQFLWTQMKTEMNIMGQLAQLSEDHK